MKFHQSFRVYQALLLTLLLVIVSGCVHSEIHEETEIPKDMGYRSIRIIDAPLNIAENQILRVENQIFEYLQEKEILSDDAGNRVEILGTIIHYDEGNKALRYAEGNGPGNGFLETRWEVVEEGTSAILGIFHISCELTGGSDGGDFTDLIEKTAKELASYLQ